jgi:hypothetical protein
MIFLINKQILLVIILLAIQAVSLALDLLIESVLHALIPLNSYRITNALMLALITIS